MTGRHHFATAGVGSHRRGKDLCAPLRAGVLAVPTIQAAVAAAGNTIQRNTVSGSFNHDCHDATSGAGTAGTANSWTSDTAATQNVANLCVTGAANGIAD